MIAKLWGSCTQLFWYTKFNYFSIFFRFFSLFPWPDLIIMSCGIHFLFATSGYRLINAFCFLSFSGWINDFLSWDVWIPLSRITYSAYLLHPFVIFGFYFNHGLTYFYSLQIVVSSNYIPHTKILARGLVKTWSHGNFSSR